MSVLLRKQYSSIKKEKLSEQAKSVLKSMYETTNGFKDAKATRKIKPKFEAFYNKLKESKPEAIVGSKAKSKAAPKKSADEFKAARLRRKPQTGVPNDKKAVEKDATRPAISKRGKRTSKAGNTYYEYRDNRLDKNPSKYPMLEKGGYMAKGGFTNKEAYELVKNKVKGSIWEQNALNILRNDAMAKPDQMFKPTGDVELLEKYMEKGGYMADGGETAKFEVDDVVYHKQHNTIGIVRIGESRGEVKTDADGNVNVDELEYYNPMKHESHKNAKIAPSTMKEIEERGLWNPFSERTSKLEKGGYMAKGGKTVGRNNQTGESFGVVIGSVKKSNEYVDGGTEMNVRISYSNRMGENKLVFDSNANLFGIMYYQYVMDGYPDTSGHGSFHEYKADKKETLKILSEMYNTAFAKRLVELAKDNEMAEGGMTEHGLRIGDKITTDMFWDNKIVVENQKTHKRAEIDLENGKRKDEMANGGEIHRLDSVFEEGGEISEGNTEMVMSQAKQIAHHAEELQDLLTEETPIEAWVVAKMQRAATDLSDITHYIDGLHTAETVVIVEEEFAKGGYMEDGGETMKEAYVQQVVEIATKANENGIRASDLTYEEFSTKVFEATNTSYAKDYLRGAYEVMKKKGYARGGELTPYIVWVSKDGEKREVYGEFKSKRAADMKMNKLWEAGEYKGMGNKPKSMYEKEGLYKDGGMMAKGGEIKIGQKFYDKNEKKSVEILKKADNFNFYYVKWEDGLETPYTPSSIKFFVDKNIWKQIEDKKMAKGGGIYSSDSLYILQVLKDGEEVAREKFRAKSLKEAKEISEDEYESMYQEKMGEGVSFIVVEAMEKGGRLSRKQKQLDLNKNGKLDAQDFKMLRAGRKNARKK